MLIAGSMAVFAAASCRDVVAGDSRDAVTDLCGTLVDCYADRYSCDDLTESANTATEQAISSFLAGFPGDCLDTCSGARACLDNETFCNGAGESCARDENCCGWSGGLSACDDDSRCCAPLGVACSGSSDCCENEACIDGFCGGTECQRLEESCRWAYECCSGRCIDDVCAPIVCSSVDEPCKNTEECCEGDTEVECKRDANTQEGRCAPKGEECPGLGAPCSLDASVCCKGFVCEAAVATQTSACVPEGPNGCKVVGFDCAEDVDCCGDLICALDAALSFCQEPPNGCQKAGRACEMGADCCSGSCVGGSCLQGTGVVCSDDEGECHPPTEVGPVIPTNCTMDPCVSTVREQDPFCKCTAWDAACVLAYKACNPANGGGP